jgi:uncharacterized membrane protein
VVFIIVTAGRKQRETRLKRLFDDPHLRMLRERPIVSGLLYGVAVFLFTNITVVPLSAIHRSPTALLALNVVSANAVLALMLFIGLPIAIAVNRYANQAQSAV